ncbi:MAG: ABC transporter substrate-binding protein [Betaproteobacteria bacterium]|nr:ABC transporter substrate-binding protein [Betaproteobacteria bacterium]
MTTLNLCSGNGMSASFRELMPQFERANNCKIEIHFEPGQILLREIKAGQNFDIGVMGKAALEQLAKEGYIVADSLRVLTQNGIGVGVSKGAPKPDLSSVEAFKRALLNAQSVAYTTEGASGIYFAGLIKKLGIEDAIKAKARMQPGGLVAELVVKGEATLAVQQVPEIMAVAGVDYVGPIPEQVQQLSINAGGVFVKSQQQALARKLLAFLNSAEAAQVFRARGLKPQKVGR